MTLNQTDQTDQTDLDDSGTEEGHAAMAPDQVEVRRNAPLAAVIGSLAGLVAIAYLARAVTGGTWVDWLVFLAIGGLALTYAGAFLDARTPLFVADRTGIRIRLGRSWQGLPWEELEEVEHAPRHTVLRDGRIVAFPVDAEAVLAGLDPMARRQARIAQRVHGAPFAVPLGVTTRVVGAEGGVTAALLALAPDPELVVEVVPDDVEELEDQRWAVTAATVPAPSNDQASDAGADDIHDTADWTRGFDASATAVRPGPAVPFGPVEEPVDFANPDESDESDESEGRDGPDDSDSPDGAHSTADSDREDTAVRPRPLLPSRTPSPLRVPVSAMRAQVTRSIARHLGNDRELVSGSSALAPRHDEVRPSVLPEFEQLRRGEDDFPHYPDHADETGVLRAETPADDAALAPRVQPVIGPQLARAREGLGLSVDRLAERTRIRGHVIEAIEVDDFVPCGGDFYARGHLRTLARVLGVDATPLLATYDDTYADAPIDARRVFEAELSTGSHGPIRSLRGGSNWSVVVAAVMAVVLAWSVARLVIDGPADPQAGAPSLSAGSAGLTSGETALAPAVPVVLTAEGGGAKVVVRDGSGKVIFKGDLAFGASRTVKASPPVRVQTSDGSLTVSVDGQKAASMGRTGKAARDTFVP